MDASTHEGNGSLEGLLSPRRDPSSPTPFGRIYSPDPGWLAKSVVEPILEPEREIIDAHHHLWDMPGFRYLLSDFLEDVGTGHKVIGTVFAECHAMYRASGPAEMKPIGEVEFAAGIAAMSESGIYGSTRINAGIVGFADLALGDRVTPVLEALIVAGGGRFRGVRCQAGWDPSAEIVNSPGRDAPGFYLQPSFQAGVRRLAAHGLSFDAWLFHPQLSDVVSLARACPETHIVLCHLGGPLCYGPYLRSGREIFAQWKARMAELAQCENISVKLGGIMNRGATFDYGASEAPLHSQSLAARWSPWFMSCVELFGPLRCMVESNFPVDKMGVGYRTLWNGFKRALGELSEDEKEAVFSGNAMRIYRLGPFETS